MSSITFRNVAKWYGDVEALRSLSLHVGEGEFMVLLGPSGCGKTTTLRCLAGLEQPTDGEIFVGERCYYSADRGVDVPPRERNIGFVFQNFALYPHMTVNQNIAFPLKTRHFKAAEIPARIREVLELVGLEGLEDRYPGQISGGQQQRVALARVLVTKPRLLLFDEPLSNLDVKLRAGIRMELKKTHGKVGATSLYVTHDQAEAMMLADRIAVMQNGNIHQVGKPEEIYHNPATLFTAGFTGNPQTNLIRGTVRKSGGRTVLFPDADPGRSLGLGEECSPFVDQEVVLNVRPEDVELEPKPGEEELKLKIYANMNEGADFLVYLSFRDEKTEIVARGRLFEYGKLQYGHEVGVRLRCGNIFSVESARNIGSFGFGAGGPNRIFGKTAEAGTSRQGL